MQDKQPTNCDGVTGEIFELKTAINPMFSQHQLAIAVGYARAGQFTLAEDLLNSINDETLSHSVLELKAKIKAQLGEYESACELWAAALQKAPNCSECVAGLQKAKSLLTLGSKRYIMSRIISAMGILTIIGLIIFLIVTMNQLGSFSNEQILVYPEIKLPTKDIELDMKLENILNEQKILRSLIESDQEYINSLATQMTFFSTSPTPYPTVPVHQSIIDTIEIHTDQVYVEKRGDQLQITFEIGLFLYNWQLSEEGKNILADISKELEPFKDDIKILVVGFTDSNETSVSELAYLRSYKAIEFMNNNSRLSEEIFLVSQGNGEKNPYPNNTIENRLRNRSVMLILIDK